MTIKRVKIYNVPGKFLAHSKRPINVSYDYKVV